MESFVPIHQPWVYRIYVKSQERLIRKLRKDIPVVVGEWCICNRYAEKSSGITDKKELAARRKVRYQEIARLQLKAWDQSKGWIYWSYQFRRDHKERLDEEWKESWDFSRCIDYGWLDKKDWGSEV